MVVKVRNRFGKPLPCCWSDCVRHGDNNHRFEVTEHDEWGSKNLTYVFCSEAHKRYYVEQVRQQQARHPLGNIRRV
jgi:hypothetical protein